MKISAKITSKGQITIPLEIRKLLGVQSGDYLEFQPLGQNLTLVPKRKQNLFTKPPEEKFQLHLKTDAITWQREMRGYDEIDEKILAQQEHL